MNDRCVKEGGGGEGRGEAWMVLQSSSTKTREITFGSVV